jgi:hypothetical protein
MSVSVRKKQRVVDAIVESEERLLRRVGVVESVAKRGRTRKFSRR